MFTELSEKLSAALTRLRGRGVLTEAAIREGLEELRRALLEADVGFDVARSFTDHVAEKAVGQASIQTVAPGQQLMKIVHDELVALLGDKQAPIGYASVPPTIVFLVGLQGSGKTTTAAKLAKRLTLEQKAAYLVAADVYRPAAVDQLVELAGRVKVGVHAEPGVSDVAGIVRRGIELAAPFQLTWSCYRETDAACGVCDSCALRLRAFQDVGADDPIAYRVRPEYAQISSKTSGGFQ